MKTYSELLKIHLSEPAFIDKLQNSYVQSQEVALETICHRVETFSNMFMSYKQFIIKQPSL